jgi:phosphoethanolamine N-methyltransferase
MSEQDHDVYTPEFLSMLQSIWGEGFLSPGGAAEVDEILAGVMVAGKDVLDIGCGLGGPAVHIATKRGAATVTGTDVQTGLVAEAKRIAADRGLSQKVRFVTVVDEALPFENESFDIVFSKDSIIHVADKVKLYSEIRRVLRPGGSLAMSDWFSGGAAFSQTMIDWLKATGLTFALKPIGETASMLEDAGFRDIRTTDRNGWYVEQARRDIEQLEGRAGAELVRLIGREAADEWQARSRKRALVAEQGHLRPGHVHAVA